MTSPTYIARLLRNEVAYRQASYDHVQQRLDTAAEAHAQLMREAELKRGALKAAIDQMQEWAAKYPETKEET